MSAPPGWHPQPDGRDRWWDGQQWTDHFRDPVQPTAPAPSPGYGTPAPYGTPGAPQGQWPPPKQGMSSGAKGCLVAAVVVVVLAVVAVVVGGIFFARTANRVVEDIRTSFPTSSAFPSGLPSDLPGGGDPVEVTVGDGFALGTAATVDPRWTLSRSGGVGTTVSGMTVVFNSSGDALPVVFTMDFEGGASTTCIATPTEGSDSAPANCLPVVDDVADDARVTVTPRF